MDDDPPAEHALIVYAVPTGPLAEQCRVFFAAADAIGSTEAQTYPPHCTLTGFFRRSTARRGLVAEAFDAKMRTTGHPPHDAVRVVRLGQHDGWIGLELESSWLIEWTAALAQDLGAAPGEEALRCKDWLHLSLAYGVDDLTPYRAPAEDLVDPRAAGGWKLALYERIGTDWLLLSGE